MSLLSLYTIILSQSFIGKYHEKLSSLPSLHNHPLNPCYLASETITLFTLLPHQYCPTNMLIHCSWTLSTKLSRPHLLLETVPCLFYDITQLTLSDFSNDSWNLFFFFLIFSLLMGIAFHSVFHFSLFPGKAHPFSFCKLFISCVMYGKLFSLSAPSVPHQQTGDTIWQENHERTLRKHLNESLSHSKPFITSCDHYLLSFHHTYSCILIFDLCFHISNCF